MTLTSASLLKTLETLEFALAEQDADEILRHLEEIVGNSAFDEYVLAPEKRDVLHQIVLHGEETPEGFTRRTRNLAVNWRRLLTVSVPSLTFAGVSTVQLPWLLPMAVLVAIAEFGAISKAPLSPRCAAVIQAIWLNGGHATVDRVFDTISANGWLQPKLQTLADVEAMADLLVKEGLATLQDGKLALAEKIELSPLN